jgi:2-oxoglutarate dehydrogenase E2 component (dihydrolipoamide succinyltransferase)
MADIIVPTEQEGTKAVVRNWLKKIGDVVRVDDPLVELETDKVAVEIAATSGGVLSEILIPDGAEVEPGNVLGRIAEGAAGSKPSTGGAGIAAVKTEAPRVKAAVDMSQLSPGIRRLLAEHKFDVGDVPVSGEKLTREDIQAEAARRAESKATAAVAGLTRVPHDTMRRRIAEHMAHSVQTAPHVTAMFEADFSAIGAHRAAHKAEFERHGANLTFTAYFVAACVGAMKAAPAVNGRWYDDRIDIYDDINIGIGTSLGEKGLIVPVIHRAQTLSLLEIAKRLTELTEKARHGKLSQEDVRGGTFSISNHGVSGSLLASPIIINQPQSAILGVGKLQKRAIVREEGGTDKIEIRPMAYVTLTIDHRVIDAFQTNAWLGLFVSTLENWLAH